MPPFPGVDFLDFDSLLSDEEKLARKSVRQFVDEQVLPIIAQHDREGTFPMHLVPEMATLGLFGANLKGYGCAEMSNVGRFRPAQLRLRAVRAGDVSHSRVRLGRPEGKMATTPSTGKGDRLLRADRTAIRLESKGDADTRGEKGR
jgi:alkylation response protein AidB-like acyl-CoA dehydrogenase